MPRVLGLLNLHHSPSLGGLTSRRPFASTSFLGRYAFCDFTLSNFSNSGIDSTGILLKEKPRSLIKHLGSGKMYNANTKLGAVTIMYNEKYANNPRYNHDINNIIENRWVLDQSNAEYIVIAPAHMIYRLDFKDVINQHIKNHAQVTMVYKRINNGKGTFIDADTLRVEIDGRVSAISNNKGAKDDVCISMETYIISRTKLEEFIDLSQMTSQFFSLRDTIKYVINQLYVHSYEYTGYLRFINSEERYLEYSLELLNKDVLKELFDDSWPIYTRTHDTPPAKYGPHSKVKNCFISNGTICDGNVENSIICRSVKIEKGARIKNSIIFSNCVIGQDAVLENCIIDKSAQIIHIKELKGTKEHPLFVNERDIV